MDSYFSSLSDIENQKLQEAVLNVVLLIAGADGEIHEDELEWAEKVAKIRTYSGPEVLRDFYKGIYDNFSERLNVRLDEVSHEVETRNTNLANELCEINPILAKLPQAKGAAMYESLVSLAKHIAKASGGFLGMWSINHQEAEWVKLPMLDAIEYPEEEA